MLLEFKVSNYLSFRDETVFSLLPAKGCKQHPDHLLVSPPVEKIKALPMAVCFGANASGKSNLFKAMMFCRDLVLTGRSQDLPIGRRCFKLEPGRKDQVSSFEWRFKHEGWLFSYGLSCTETLISEEWLYGSQGGGKLARLFQRETQPDGTTELTFAANVKLLGQSKEFLTFVAQGTRPNQPFLTEAEGRNVPLAALALRWFRNKLLFLTPDSHALNLPFAAQENPAEFLRFLISADTGVSCFSTRTRPETVSFEQEFAALPPTARAQLSDTLGRIDSPQISFLGSPGGSMRYYLKDTDDPHLLRRVDLIFQHQRNQTAEFLEHEESRGTQRLLHLIPALLDVCNQGRILFIDELDTSLHPLLSKHLLTTFLAIRQPDACGQLMVNTHETSLLDLEVLRSDEIHFFEKDNQGASHVTSLASYNTRSDLRIDKGYLHGRFGAIPYLGNPIQILEAEA